MNGWKLPLLFAVTFASAVLEGVTLAALLPLLSTLGSQAGQAATDRVSSIFNALFALVGQPPTPAGIGALVALLILASACVYMLQAFITSRLHAAYIASWQRRLLTAFLEADYSFFRHRRASDLIAAVTTESVRLGLGFIQANIIVTSVLFIAIQAAIAFFVAPLVVGLLVILAGLLFLMTRPLAARARDIGRETTELNADLLADSNEFLSGAKFVKATSTETRAITRLSTVVYHLQRVTFKNSFDGHLVRAAFEYPGGLAMVALIVAAPTLLGVDVGVILVVVAMFVRLFPRITGLRQSMQILGVCLPALGTTAKLIQEAKNQTESIDCKEPAGWKHDGPARIDLENVSVVAEGSTILKDVTLAIPPGSFVAITGTTGSGKTTLLDCILGLRKPTTGRIFIDGISLNELPGKTWRNGIGYLGQDPVLFNSSIADNLRWIRPETTDDEIYSALKSAAAEFVKEIPLGLNTTVGDHGGRLSGGERQRIALARALIGNPRVLVLDEATSALDAETEESVTKALAAMKGRITILAITHRPALVREADFVIHLEGGLLQDFTASQIRAAV